MNLLDAIILGIIQGLTEFLPVSSSGHLEIARSVLGIEPESGFYFTVVLHGATVLSTIVVFAGELLKLTKGILRFQINEETSYLFKIFVSMIPVGFTGFFLKDRIESLFTGNIIFVGSMLLVTSALLFAGHLMKGRERSIGYFDALIIGIAQAVAVIPGISRSGATISTGLLLGNRKDEIARFSFLMVLIPVIGANIVEIFTGDTFEGDVRIFQLIAGFTAAFITGYLACKWMVELVKRSKMIWFSAYCAIVGLIAIIVG